MSSALFRVAAPAAALGLCLQGCGSSPKAIERKAENAVKQALGPKDRYSFSQEQITMRNDGEDRYVCGVVDHRTKGASPGGPERFIWSSTGYVSLERENAAQFSGLWPLVCTAVAPTPTSEFNEQSPD